MSRQSKPWKPFARVVLNAKDKVIANRLDSTRMFERFWQQRQNRSEAGLVAREF